jgi:hypothetical protein
MRRELLICLFLIVATLAVFWQVRNHELVNFDDHHYITENPHLQAGLTPKNVIWAFTTTHASNWHPLTWLSHMLDCQLYGLNPSGHHLTSVLLHLANTLLLFLVLRRMTGALWRSGFVAALFALHPLHVEPCGVGCLGGGTEGCLEHLILDAHHMGLLPLCFPSRPH